MVVNMAAPRIVEFHPHVRSSSCIPQLTKKESITLVDVIQDKLMGDQFASLSLE